MSDLGRLVADRYRLVERIGRGGMGTVWRAEDELLGRHVAVKKLHVPPHLEDDELRRLYERTRREARSAARVAHPHVIVVHDVVDDEGLPCIVMEYIPSVTLSDVLKEGVLPPDEAARIGCVVAGALSAAHGAGVLHRDVKPANVLLGNDGRVVLTDFGIALESGTPSLTRTGELVGSLDYLAPERLKGSAEAGFASDLWSLGAMLYQAVEGRPPFRRDTPIETAYAIAAYPYEPLTNAGELAPVIEGLLVKEPGQRMGVRQAERLLADAAGAQTARLDRPTRPAHGELSPAPAQRSTRRRTVLRSVAGLAVAAVVAGGAVLLWPHEPAGAGKDTAATGSVSAQPPSTSPSAAPAIPSGYHRETEKMGLSVPVPDGWTRKERPDGEVAYLDPSGLVGLRVNAVQFAGSDPVRHWSEVEEDQTRRDNPGYELVRMSSTTFRGRPAGYWEFTFKGRVRDFRAVELAFANADGTQYVIYLSAPSEQWKEYRPVFDNAVKGIHPSA
ncbi:protein kinase domain-containing protein [Streptomyces sp. NPDC054841]